MQRWTSVLVAGLLIVAACGDDDTDDDAAPTTTTTDAPTSTTTVPADTDDPAGWPTAGGDLANTRAATGSPITAATVDSLEVRWESELAEFGSLSTVPVVVDGIVYVQGGSGQIAAIDLATGEPLWTSAATGFNIGPFGVAVDDAHVYGLDGTNGVLAVDRATGEPVWAADLTTTPTLGIDIQPVVASGLVFASSVPISFNGIYAPGDRGVFHALDATTGEIRWSFDTVEGDDLWGHPEINSGGGVWYPPAIDEDRGLVYIGVANPAPFPGTPEFPNGSSRPGDNLYTDSIVALDLATGALRWFHQVIPHDLFDRDQVHALVAAGDDGDVVISAGKSGVVVGLDPDDGTVRWSTPIGRHEHDDLAELTGPTSVLPGTYGGVLTPPSTADGVVYLATVNAPTELTPDATSYIGSELGSLDGQVVAVDADDGTIVWDTEVPGDPLGGTTVVGDLVFTALLTGEILALDRDTGEIVWTHDSGGGINGWMSVVDDLLIVPVGIGEVPRLLALGPA